MGGFTKALFNSIGPGVLIILNYVGLSLKVIRNTNYIYYKLQVNLGLLIYI